MHPGAVRHISPRAALVLMSKPKPKLNDKQREMVKILKRCCPGFATMRHLVLSFRTKLPVCDAGPRKLGVLGLRRSAGLSGN